MVNKESWREEFELKCKESYAKGGFMTTDMDSTWEVDMGLVKSFIKDILNKEREKEIRLFMDEILKKANTTLPNLILNEIINYAYDRLKAINTK